jgi:hypothetical protein
MIAPRRAAAVALAVAACNSSPPSTTRDTGSGRAAALDATAMAALPERSSASAQAPVPGPGAVPDPVPDAGKAAPPIQKGAPQIIVMDEPALALPSEESFRLLDPGRGARAALRYRTAATSTAVIARTTLASRRLEHGALSSPTRLPEIRDGFAIAIDADHPGRVALHPLVAESAADTADADAYLAPWRTLLQDHRATVEVNDRGAIIAIHFDDDPAGARSARAKDELVQRLLSLIVPLPAEPIAAGARWRVVTILRQGPTLAKQTATYTLIARRAAGWKLHVQLVRVAEQQRITDPSLPPGTAAELIALFRTLEGDVEVDPELPLIAGGALAIESRLHARLQPPGQAPVEQIFEDTGRLTLARCRENPAHGTGRANCADSR